MAEEAIRTPLHISCEEGDYNKTKSLLRKNLALINAIDKNWWTPLHCAASSKSLKICKLLLKFNADVSLLNNSRTSVLHYLARIREEEFPIKQRGKDGLLQQCLKMIIDRAADVNVRNSTGTTPLHEACFRGSLSTVEFFVNFQAKLDVKDKYGETPLYYAVRAGRPDIVKYLLEQGATPDIRGKRGSCLDVVPNMPTIKEEIINILTGYLQKKALKDKECGIASSSKDVVIANTSQNLPTIFQEELEATQLTTLACDNFRILMRILHETNKQDFLFCETPEGQLFKNADPTKIYRKLDEAGQGAFGKVFNAKNLQNKTMVVVKRLPHVTKAERFNNFAEVISIQAFDHPNIVRYIDAYVWREELWLIMEVLEGGSLKEAIESKKWSEGEISYVARQILKALHYLKTQSIVHRDIKSNNIMLGINGDVKLIDFGLCVNFSRKLPKGIAGSPYWIAPEVALNHYYSWQADIWSTAATLVEIANREPPFGKSNLRALISVCAGIAPSLDNPNVWACKFKEFLSLIFKFNPAERSTAQDLYKWTNKR
eukprot:TRINITY_DN1489_c0_g2_i8.p1 TRINITY_DN1489_c0_g2~~TRINITY_DN1489_c0_g2_i8.p1  ORF type:complete len:544 (+),score=227.88 TRINITY_DN1489_c0_g2_i8:476-2107(+)